MITAATENSSLSFSEQSDSSLNVPSTQSQLLREPGSESPPSVVGSSSDLTHSEPNTRIFETDKGADWGKAYSSGVISKSDSSKSLNEELDGSLDIIEVISRADCDKPYSNDVISKSGSSELSKGVLDGSIDIIEGNIILSSSNASSNQSNVSSPHLGFGNVTSNNNDGGFILPTQPPQPPPPHSMSSNSEILPWPASTERGRSGGYGSQFYRGQPQHQTRPQGNTVRGSHDSTNWDRARGRGAGHNGNDNLMQQAQGVSPMWPYIPYGTYPHNSSPYMMPMETYGTYSYMGHPDQGVPSQFEFVSIQPPSRPSLILGYPYIPMQYNHIPMYNHQEERAKLNIRIMRQIDYYFSDSNLVTDVFLRKQMDSQGWVPIETIATFNMIALMTNDIDVILNAVKSSNHLEVQGNMIRRREDFARWPILESIVQPVNPIEASLNAMTPDEPVLLH